MSGAAPPTTAKTNGAAASSGLPAELAAAVLSESAKMPDDAVAVKGHDFNHGTDMNSVMQSLLTTGFQATNLALAIEEVKKMRRWRLSDEPVKEDEDEELKSPAARAKVRTTIFMGFTSNMVSAGTREIIRWLVEHKKVDVLVTTGGAIEEDLMKCMTPHYMGTTPQVDGFELKGAELRRKGINRIGNLLVPNSNYCAFEDWMTPILDAMLAEQKAAGTVWSPQTMIARLGKEIDNKESVLYWAQRHGIPIYCPAITDGSIGDMVYFHSFKSPGLVLDIAQDIRSLNNRALKARRSGMLIFGGGLVKHHICNANLMRNGADHAVFVNTGEAFEGSDSGASPDEAVSWGKIRSDARPIKVHAEASLIMPLLVAQSFAKETPFD